LLSKDFSTAESLLRELGEVGPAAKIQWANYYLKSGALSKAIEKLRDVILNFDDLSNTEAKRVTELCLVTQDDELLTFLTGRLTNRADDFDLLCVLDDCYRNLGQRAKSADITDSIVTRYPFKYQGFHRRVQNALALKDENLVEKYAVEMNKKFSKKKKTIGEIVPRLFNTNDKKLFSQIYGPTNSNFRFLTNFQYKIYQIFLNHLDAQPFKYYLFAASSICLQRGRDTVPWLDDVDVMILEDQIEQFEVYAKNLARLGLDIKRSLSAQGCGGYQLSLAAADGVAMKIFPESSFKIYPASFDFFYGIRHRGNIRNPRGWGLFHKVCLPESFIGEGRRGMHFGGLRPFFSNADREVLYLYGDVNERLAVGSHSKMVINPVFTDVQGVIDEVQSIIEAMKNDGSLFERDVKDTNLRGGIYRVESESCLVEVLAVVITTRPDTICLDIGPHTLFVPDILRYVPAAKINIHAYGAAKAGRAWVEFLFWLSSVYPRSALFVDDEPIRRWLSKQSDFDASSLYKIIFNNSNGGINSLPDYCSSE